MTPRVLLRSLRRGLGQVRRSAFPRAEIAAWRLACRQAETQPRRVPGDIQLLDYRIRYVDLLSLCPQWHDIFVRNVLHFACEAGSPRILDCGANVGLSSLYFKRMYPNARITAFEADPAIAAVLSGNLTRNGFGDVEVVSAAVWTRGGSLAFRSEGSDSGGVEEVSPGLVGRSVKVPAVRLRDLLERESVDLLKLDIEGAEEAVLSDCEPVLGNVSALVMELHEFRRAHRSTPAVLELLSRAGFTYALDDLAPNPDRAPKRAGFLPFPQAVSAWSTLVRAWRETPL